VTQMSTFDLEVETSDVGEGRLNSSQQFVQAISVSFFWLAYCKRKRGENIILTWSVV
jgi:hypothetical protein